MGAVLSCAQAGDAIKTSAVPAKSHGRDAPKDEPTIQFPLAYASFPAIFLLH
ncbi:hypothetical protein MGWOODY_Smn2279 [hydrothermal vent metagenome]|uniref:Uncharacterized protein n=1 Tax=hydrothermal vent metagenome TaxID=652676 RepID=A0A160TLD1_9ZZZZ